MCNLHIHTHTHTVLYRENYQAELPAEDPHRRNYTSQKHSENYRLRKGQRKAMEGRRHESGLPRKGNSHRKNLQIEETAWGIPRICDMIFENTQFSLIQKQNMLISQWLFVDLGRCVEAKNHCDFRLSRNQSGWQGDIDHITCLGIGYWILEIEHQKLDIGSPQRARPTAWPALPHGPWAAEKLAEGSRKAADPPPHRKGSSPRKGCQVVTT